MKRVTKKNILEKNLFKKIFLVVIFLISQNIFSTDNSAKQLPLDLFNNYILAYSFNKSTSINALRKSYYNFSLVSKCHNTATKDFWNKNWFNIMKDVCDQHRFERLYFAGIFYHINDEIKEYFETHLFVYKTLQYLSANQNFVHPPNLEWFCKLDPNFTMFGPNCQMSLLECCIKAGFYPVNNKTELCIHLIKNGAQYDIWMYRGIMEKRDEGALVDTIESIKKESEDPYGPFLLSEYIARHVRCNEQLAKEIIQKGTCVQDIFIKRFPNLKIYTKKQHIPKPPIPENFINNHHFSEIRYLQIVFKGIFIPYYLNNGISLIKKSTAYKEVTQRLKKCYEFKEKLKDIGNTTNIFYYFDNSSEGSFIKEILTIIAISNNYQGYNEQKNALIKKFQEQYRYDNQDSENKNAHEYFNKFTQLTKISMNQDTTKWLTQILDKKNLACNQNSIVLDESIMKGIKDLNSCLPNAPELPLKTPNKNFNKAQYYLIKKIFLNLLLIGGIILIWMQLKNLIKSI